LPEALRHPAETNAGLQWRPGDHAAMASRWRDWRCIHLWPDLVVWANEVHIHRWFTPELNLPSWLRWDKKRNKTECCWI